MATPTLRAVTPPSGPTPDSAEPVVIYDLPSGGGSTAWADVTGKPATYPPVVGTTATTAKAGNYQPTAANISDATATGRSVLTATDAAAARTAIGAGTSNLAIGTTASTAAAGNHTQAATTVTVAAIPDLTGANVQLALADLAARVKALEDAAAGA